MLSVYPQQRTDAKHPAALGNSAVYAGFAENTDF